MASPETTLPSSGIRFPVRTIILSPSEISFIETKISCSSVLSQTFSTLRDMAPARSETDFLCVHSSSSSPSLNINITDEAVSKSRRKSETVTAVASSTDTESLPSRKALSPVFI